MLPDDVVPAVAMDVPFVCGDARKMDAIADGSVALVVTSPPYFAGKQYEEELDRDGVPASYLEYLAQKFPRTFHCLASIDRRIGRLPLLRSMGDCVLLQFERTEG